MTAIVIGLIVSIAAFAAYTVALSRAIRSDGLDTIRRSGEPPRSHQPDQFEFRPRW